MASKRSSFFSLYNFVRMIFRLAMNVFFRDIQIVGEHNIPQSGPVIFCGNHFNQFIDATMIFSYCKRDISFLCAAKTMRRKFYGDMANAMQCISVERPQDLATNGKGLVRIQDSKIIEGEGTQFKKEFQPGDIIRFVPKDKEYLKVEDQIIESIENDTEILLKDPGIKIYDSSHSYSFKILPKVDQTAVFKNVITHLSEGGTVGIFPEGGSHDQSDILPFKAGVAFMALGTTVSHDIPVTIIPCGLKYFNRQQFRSKVILEFGRPYQASQKCIDLYKESDKKKAALSMFLKDIEERMREITLTAPSYNELQAIYTIRNLYMPKSMPQYTPEQRNDIYQRFFKGFRQFRDDQEVKTIIEDVTEYRQQLKTLNIRDSQVKGMRINICHLFYNFIFSFVRMILSFLFALPGMMMLIPLGMFLAYFAEKERRKALAGSDVKVKAVDVMASVKVAASIVLYPFHGIFFAFLLYEICRRYLEYSRSSSFEISVIFFILYPIYSIICIRSSDGVARHFKDMQGRLITFFHTDKVVQIQLHRKQLKKKVKEWVNRIGPTLFKNFDKLQMIRKQGENAFGANSRTPSKRGTPFMSRNASKSDLQEFDLDYMDELEISRAFSCLQELENI